MIYNVEFRLGDTALVTKIYLPVRHYCASDAAVTQALNDYFHYRQRGKYMPNYVKAMSTLSNAESLRAQSGLHTYVGCTVQCDGTLRMVSYLKPQVVEHLFSDEAFT